MITGKWIGDEMDWVQCDCGAECVHHERLHGYRITDRSGAEVGEDFELDDSWWWCDFCKEQVDPYEEKGYTWDDFCDQYSEVAS